MEAKSSHGKIRRNLAFVTVPATHLLCGPGQPAFPIHTSVTICNADKDIYLRVVHKSRCVKSFLEAGGVQKTMCGEVLSS